MHRLVALIKSIMIFIYLMRRAIKEVKGEPTARTERKDNYVYR
jgi:hypothetical protein